MVIRNRYSPPRRTGFSLIELLMVVAMLSVIAAISIPDLTHALRSADAVTASRQLHLHMSLARNTAMTRREHVVLCPAFEDPAEQVCDNTTNWTKGWWVFIDVDRDQEIGDEDRTIAWGQPLRPGVKVRQGRSGIARAVRFKPHGDAWPNTSFYICTSSDPAPSRRVVLYRSGRARITGTGKAGCQWLADE